MSGAFGLQQSDFERAISDYKNNAGSVAQGAISGFTSVDQGKQSLTEAGATAESSIDTSQIQAKMKEEGTKFMKEMGIDFSTPGALKGLSKLSKFAGKKLLESNKANAYGGPQESLGADDPGNIGVGTPGQGDLYRTEEYGEPGAGGGGDGPPAGTRAGEPEPDDIPATDGGEGGEPGGGEPEAPGYADVDGYTPPDPADVFAKPIADQPPLRPGEADEFTKPGGPDVTAQPVEDLPPIRPPDFKGTFADELPKVSGDSAKPVEDAPPAYDPAGPRNPDVTAEPVGGPPGYSAPGGEPQGPDIMAKPVEDLPAPRTGGASNMEQTIQQTEATTTQDADNIANQAAQTTRNMTSDVDQTIANTTEETSSIASTLTEAGGSFLSSAGGFLGDLMPFVAPILAGWGLYSGIKDMNKAYGAEGTDPYAAVRTQLAAGQSKVTAMGSQISADQFASKIGGAAPAFGSLAAPTFSTAQQMGGATGHF